MNQFLYRLVVILCVMLALAGIAGVVAQAQQPNLDAPQGSVQEVQPTDTDPGQKESSADEDGSGPVVKVVPEPDDPRWKLAQEWIEVVAPPALTDRQLLGLAYWQWIWLFLFILTAVIIDFSVQLAFRVLVRRRLPGADQQERREELRRTMRPFGLYAAAVFCQLTLNFLQFEGAVYEITSGALAVFAVLAGALSAWRVVDLISQYLARQAEKTATRFDDIIIPLVRKTLKIFVVAIGLLYLANSLGIEVWPLIASLGLGGVAFAFAAKDTVENFFGSVAVLMDRPFDIGDWVVIDGHEGMVEAVGFRSTRIRTFYNSQITVPNANLVRAIVDNYGRRKYRRWKSVLSLQYDTPPDRLLAMAEGVRELIRQHPYTRKDYYHVWVNEFNSSSIDILLYLFFEVPDWGTELRERERLLVDIVRLADTIGVSFAFPTTTVHLYKEEQPPQYGQHDKPQRNSDRRSMAQGMRAARQIVEGQPWKENRPAPVDFGKDDLGNELDAAGNPIDTPEDDQQTK
ncbi:MAG: mechanosensitive ion channel [Phycisphaeraceae bacterium]